MFNLEETVLSAVKKTPLYASDTLEEIFRALKRKESYGTSEPLNRLRVFGSWNFTEATLDNQDWIEQGYKNVPMGGDLPDMPEAGLAPSFVISAAKDPESGNLDRIQVVKGYYQDGYPWEKIYDVAWSDNRQRDAKTGKLPPVGNTVNIKKASSENSIGDTQLSAVWTDPALDPSLHAIYYVRVIEIPTPRWSTYDAAALGVEPLPDVPATIQERAWPSPIWYTP